MIELFDSLKRKRYIKTQKVYDSMINVDRDDFSHRNPYMNSP